MALRSSVAIGLVTKTRLRYRLTIADDLKRGCLFLAARRVGVVYALGVSARANEAVEFASLSRDSMAAFIAYKSSSAPQDVVRFEQVLRDA